MSRKTKKFLRNIEAKVKVSTIVFFVVIMALSSVFVLIPPMQKTVSAETVDQFSYYKTVTFDHDQVPSTLTNFPVVVNLSSDTDLASDALDSGYDIAFFDDEDNQLAHEIELFNGTTGQLVAWVNVTSLSSSEDTVISMYYGDSDIGSSAENVTGTWNGNYLAVWHFHEASGNIIDSTSNDNDGSTISITNQNVTSIIGKGYEFDASNANNITVTPTSWDGFDTEGDSFTIMSYFNFHGVVGDNAKLMTGGEGGTSYMPWSISPWGDGNYRYDMYNGAAVGVSGTHMLNNTYHMMTFRYDGSADNLSGFNDGSYVGGISATQTTVDWDIVIIGKYKISNSDQVFDGIIDEIRISGVKLSNDWISTEYNSMNNATDGGFFILGSEQSGTSGIYEISGLTNSQFTFSGEAGDMVWANDTSDGTSAETLAIHTNLSGTSNNCTDIFLDFSTWIGGDMPAGTLNITLANVTDNFGSTIYSLLGGSNVTVNNSNWDSNAWCNGANPFDTNNSIDKVNRTFYVRVRQTIPIDNSTGIYEVTAASATCNICWKVIS